MEDLCKSKDVTKRKTNFVKKIYASQKWEVLMRKLQNIGM